MHVMHHAHACSIDESVQRPFCKHNRKSDKKEPVLL